MHTFCLALTFAAFAHQHQVRKDGTPYIAHLLTVSALVLEAGGSEEAAIAALLHDYLEDINPQGFALLEDLFGIRVANMVLSLTEQESKDQYLKSVELASEEIQLVSFCDKLHNLRGYATGRAPVSNLTVEFLSRCWNIYSTCDIIPGFMRNEYCKLLEKLVQE